MPVFYGEVLEKSPVDFVINVHGSVSTPSAEQMLSEIRESIYRAFRCPDYLIYGRASLELPDYVTKVFLSKL